MSSELRNELINQIYIIFYLRSCCATFYLYPARIVVDWYKAHFDALQIEVPCQRRRDFSFLYHREICSLLCAWLGMPQHWANAALQEYDVQPKPLLWLLTLAFLTPKPVFKVRWSVLKKHNMVHIAYAMHSVKLELACLTWSTWSYPAWTTKMWALKHPMLRLHLIYARATDVCRIHNSVFAKLFAWLF